MTSLADYLTNIDHRIKATQIQIESHLDEHNTRSLKILAKYGIRSVARDTAQALAELRIQLAQLQLMAMEGRAAMCDQCQGTGVSRTPLHTRDSKPHCYACDGAGHRG